MLERFIHSGGVERRETGTTRATSDGDAFENVGEVGNAIGVRRARRGGRGGEERADDVEGGARIGRRRRGPRARANAERESESESESESRAGRWGADAERWDEDDGWERGDDEGCRRDRERGEGAHGVVDDVRGARGAGFERGAVFVVWEKRGAVVLCV